MSAGNISDSLIGVNEYVVPKPTAAVPIPSHVKVTSVDSNSNTVTAGGKTYNINDVYKCSSSGSFKGPTDITGIRTGGGYRKSRRQPRRGRKKTHRRRRH